MAISIQGNAKGIAISSNYLLSHYHGLKRNVEALLYLRSTNVGGSQVLAQLLFIGLPQRTSCKTIV